MTRHSTLIAILLPVIAVADPARADPPQQSEVQLRQEILAEKKQKLGDDHWEVTDAQLLLADAEMFGRLDEHQRTQLEEANRLDSQAADLYAKQEYQQATSLRQRRLAILRQLYGPDHWLCARELNYLGVTFSQLADAGKSELCYRDALRIQRPFVGNDHPLTATVLNNLGLITRGQNAPAQAATFFRQAAEVRRGLFGARNKEYSNSLTLLAGELEKLANTAESGYDFPAARKAREEILAIKTQIRGREHWHVKDAQRAITFLDQLEQLNSDQRTQLSAALVWEKNADERFVNKEFKRSVALREKALATRRQLFGEEHIGYAEQLNLLGVTYVRMEQFARAEILQRKSQALWETLAGDDHPGVAQLLKNLGYLYNKTGDLSRATQHYRRASDIYRRLHGDDSPDYRAALDSLVPVIEKLAEEHERRRAFDSARKARQEVLDIKRQLDRPDWQLTEARVALQHLEQLAALDENALSQLAATEQQGRLSTKLRAEGRDEEAIAAAKQALEATSRILGSESRTTARRAMAVGDLLASTDKYAEAAEYHQRALDIYRKVVFQSHPDFAIAASMLAQDLEKNGELEQAARWHLLAASTIEQFEGAKSDWTKSKFENVLRVHDALAQQYRQDGDLAAERRARREILKVTIKIEGERHWITTDARLALHHVDRVLALDDAARAQLAEADKIHQHTLVLEEDIKFDEALPAARRVVEIHRQVLGSDCRQTAYALIRLGNFLDVTGDPQAAMKCFREALAIRETVLGSEHPWTANNHQLVAALAGSIGDTETTRHHWQHALDVRNKLFGKDHRGAAYTLERLAELAGPSDGSGERPLSDKKYNLTIRRWQLTDQSQELREAGKPDEARAAARKSLALTRALASDQRRTDAIGWLRIASELFMNGDYDNARNAFHQAAPRTRKVYGEESWLYKDAQHHLELVDKIGALDGSQSQAWHKTNDLLDEVRQLNAKKKYRDAISLAERALSVRRELLGNSQRTLVPCLTWLGALHGNDGNLVAARKYYDEAVAVAKATFGVESPLTPGILINLGAVHEQAGNTAEARSCYEQALAIRRKVSGTEDDNTVEAMSKLGIFLRKIGHHTGAIQHLEEALAVSQRLNGPEHANVANQHENLGYLYRDLKDYGAARQQFQQSLAIWRKIYGSDHLTVASTLQNLGDTCRESGDYRAAADFHKESLRIRRQALGNENYDTATSMVQLAMTYLLQGDLKKAEPLFQEGAAAFKAANGTDRPDYRATLSLLARLYTHRAKAEEEQEDYAAAIALRGKALSLRMDAGGAADSDTIDARLDLKYTQRLAGLSAEQRQQLTAASDLLSQAAKHAGQRQFDQAIRLAQSAYQTRSDVLGPKHYRTGKSLQEIAYYHFQNKDFVAAEPLYRHVVAIFETHCGKNHGDRCALVLLLALTLRSLGEYDEAESLFHEIIPIIDKQQGTRSSDYQVALRSQAQLYQAWAMKLEEQAKFDLALKHRGTAHHLRLRLYGPDHWKVIESRVMLDRAKKLVALDADALQRYLQGRRLASEGSKAADQKRYGDAIALAGQALEMFGDLLGHEQPDVIDLVAAISSYREKAGDDVEALDQAKQAVASSAKVFGEHHPTTAKHQLRLGGLLLELERNKEARAALEAALAVFEKTENVLITTALNDLALLLDRLGHHTQAEQYFERALMLCEKRLGPHHPRTITVLGHLGLHHRKVGDHRAAKEHLEAALRMCRKTYGDQHAVTAANLEALGLTLRDLGEYSEARRSYEQALEFYRLTESERHPKAIDLMRNLAFVLLDLDEFETAREYLNRALKASLTVHGPEHPRTGICYNTLGRLARVTGDYDAARSHFERCLEIHRKALGPDHPDSIESLGSLAYLAQLTRDYALARKLCEEVLERKKRIYGSTDPRTGRALVAAGRSLGEMRYYATARVHLEESLAIFRKSYGEEHRQTARALYAMGYLLAFTEDYSEARRYMEKALAIERNALGNDHPDVAKAACSVAAILLCMGSDSAARPYLEEALEIETSAYGPYDLRLGPTLNNLCNALEHSDPPAAERYAQQQLDIYRRKLEQEDTPTAISLIMVGDQLRKMDRYKEALEYFTKALEVRKQRLGLNHTLTAVAFQNVGIATAEVKDRAAALPFYQLALNSVRNARGPDHVQTASYMMNLGRSLARLQNTEQAKAHFDRAIAIYESHYGEEHSITHGAMHSAGATFWGDIAKGRPYLERALRIRERVLGPNHTDTAVTRAEIANGLLLAGNEAEAWDHFAKAVSQIGSVRSRYLSSSAQHEHYGLTSFRREYLERFLNLAENLAPLDDDKASQLLALLLDWKAAAGRSLLARQEALMFEQDEITAALAKELKEVGRQLMLAQLRPADAQHRKRVDQLSVRHAELERKLANRVKDYAALRQSHQAGPDRIAAELGVQGVLLELVKYRRFGYRPNDPQPGMGPHRYAAVILCAQNKGAWLTDVSKAEARSKELARPLLIHFTAKWAGPARQMEQQVLAAPDVLEELGAKVVAVKVDINQQQQLASRFGINAIPSQVLLGADGKELARLKGSQPKEAFLKLLADLPVHIGGAKFVVLGEAEPIEEAIREWRAAARSGRIGSEVESRLRRRVWDPIAAALPAGRRRLFVAPDGQLSLLPFEAIRLDDGRYLVEQYQVSYVSNGRDLMPRLKPAGELGGAVVFADPDYDADVSTLQTAPNTAAQLRRADPSRYSHYYSRLPGFAREAATVERTWQTARPRDDIVVYQGAAATKQQLRDVRRPQLLYMVTHGFFDPTFALAPVADERDEEPSFDAPSPPIGTVAATDRGLILLDSQRPQAEGVSYADPRLQCGLALAGANRPGPGRIDGVLTAMEVQDLDLWGTQLVVLSACETGLGKVSVGEGVLGLRRAFQQAGAETVIASLWKVPDAETKQLMTGFFDRWLNGQPKADALRSAQLELIQQLRDSKDPRRHSAPVHYWAGFICHGQAD